jgi:hypothetical protein
MIKFAEGGSNPVFRLDMNNDTVVIACIPYPVAGSGSLLTAVEIAGVESTRLYHSAEDSIMD